MTAIEEAVNKALACHSAGQKDKATEIFEKILDAAPDHPLALEYLGVRAIKRKKFPESEAYLTRAIDGGQARADCHLHLGRMYRDTLRWDRAIENYRNYLETQPTNTTALIELCLALGKVGHLNEAIVAAERAVETAPGVIEPMCTLASALRQAERSADATTAWAVAASYNVEDERDKEMKANALMALGRLDEAVGVADHLNLMGLESFIDLPQGDDLDKALTHIPPLIGEHPCQTGSPLLFVGGGVDYVDRYASNLIRSVAARAPEMAVHIHIVSPSGVTIDDHPLKLLCREVDVTITSEKTKPNPTYCATIRFVRLAQIFRNLKRPVIASDIDSLVLNQATEQLNKLIPFDVALLFRNDQVFVQQQLAAGFVALWPTANARRYMDSVAAYIAHFLKVGNAHWFLDQLALFTAARVLSNLKDIKIVEAPLNVLDWDRYDEKSLIWTTKGQGSTLPSLPHTD